MNTDKCNSVKTVKSILLQVNDITNSTPIYYKPSKELIDTITPLLLLTLISNISKIYKTIEYLVSPVNISNSIDKLIQ